MTLNKQIEQAALLWQIAARIRALLNEEEEPEAEDAPKDE
jgi:hypothetical protein